jgi:hypothetical protein
MMESARMTASHAIHPNFRRTRAAHQEGGEALKSMTAEVHAYLEFRRYNKAKKTSQQRPPRLPFRCATEDHTFAA